MLHTKRFTRELRCKLTEEELLDRARALANACEEVSAEERRQKEIKSDLKAQLEAKEAARAQLSAVVSAGAEYRSIDVEQVFDFETGMVTLYRTDTGEQIERRRMTEDERQMPLPA